MKARVMLQLRPLTLLEQLNFKTTATCPLPAATAATGPLPSAAGPSSSQAFNAPNALKDVRHQVSSSIALLKDSVKSQSQILQKNAEILQKDVVAFQNSFETQFDLLFASVIDSLAEIEKVAQVPSGN